MSRLSALFLVFVVGCTPRLYTSDLGVLTDWVAPENSWTVQQPPEHLHPDGFFEGETVPDVRLPDQFGDEVSLWQFAGNVILLDVSAIWCRPCQELAAGTQEVQDEHASDGFMYVTVLQENVDSDPPSQTDLEFWAAEFGISAPILGEQESPQTAEAVVNGVLPAVVLIDRDLTVHARLPSDEEQIIKAIEELL